LHFNTEEMRQILTSASSGTKIAYMFLLLLVGLLAAGVLLTVFARIPALGMGGTAMIYLSSTLQAILAFALPAYLVTAWTHPKPIHYLKIEKSRRMGQKMIFGLLAFLLSYFFVSFLTQWNKGIELPESMHAVERWMRSLEDAALETTDRLLSGESMGSLVLNLVIVAALAAVSEELFFRGALQQFMQEKFHNGHAAVWLSALVFSAVHFQFYGFFPRMALGALLGYLFLYTHNLWIPILVHFINNATVIILAYFRGGTEWMSSMENRQITLPFIMAAMVSAGVTVLLFRVYTKESSGNASQPANTYPLK